MFAKYLSVVILSAIFNFGFFIPLSQAQSGIDSAVILQYHHISTQTPPSTSTSPERFLEHITLIEQEGFTVRGLPWLIDRIQNKASIPDKTVVITFDDGYLSIYEKAFPLLKARNWPFTIFVSPEAIDQKWGESLSWDQLREMQLDGATIANHSFSHLHLLDRIKKENGDIENKQEWLERIQQDIEKTERRIKQELGVEHRLLAYPYGEYNQDLQSRINEMGFVALGQHSGPVGFYSDLTALPRFPAAGIYANPATLKTKLYSLPFQVVEDKNETEITVNEPPTFSFKVKQNGFRSHQVQCFYQGSPISTNIAKNEDVYTIRAQAKELSGARRHRYNCTAPNVSGQRYYWLSHPWVTQF